MIKDLILVGAGGMAREVLQWVKDINFKHQEQSQSPKWKIKGFIDDNLSALTGFACDYKIIGKISEWLPDKNEEFALSISSPNAKEKIVNLLRGKGAKFADIIHPSAKICEFTEHGEGLVMYPHSQLNPNCKIGNFVTLLSSGIPHDAVVEDFATISSNCGLTRGVYIGRKAFLAAHVSIMPGRKIGEESYVGIGSVVIRNVPKGKKVFGNPAKIIDI